MRIGTASVRRTAQLLAFDPTISVEPLRGNIDTRLRKARERGLDALVLAACGLDRLGLAERDRPAASGRDDAARGGAGRARAAGARRRGGARRARGDSRRDAAAGRGRARVRRARSAPAASRPSPRITTASGSTALIAAEDGSWVERRERRRPGRARRRAARRVRAAGRVKVIVTRPRAQAQPLVGRLEALGLRGRRVPADRDRSAPPTSRSTAPATSGRSSRARTAPTRSRAARATCPKVAAVGPGTAETLRSHGIEPAFVADGLDRRAGCSPSSRSPRGR